ncbi:MAG: hypothetical protein FJ038_04325 [Chloroflexi bacterium]|nr:hypothetical protein [Chloroflexota bacterium]
MLGTIFHYSVTPPEDDHANCEDHRNRVIAMHERMGYRWGGAYNGHFCHHGGFWLSYEGPNQASGNNWANLNLEAWCYLGTVGTEFTREAQHTAYQLTLRNPREHVHAHSTFFPTACPGDPVRDWVLGGALPVVGGGVTTTPEVPEMFIAWGKTVFGVPIAALIAGGRVVLDLSGPEGAYGIPQPALDWKAGGGRDAVPLINLDPVSLAAVVQPPAPPAGGGGGGVTAVEVRQIVVEVLDGTTLRV